MHSTSSKGLNEMRYLRRPSGSAVFVGATRPQAVLLVLSLVLVKDTVVVALN